MQDYEAVRERVVEPGAWPKDQPLLLRPLTLAPVELDLCSSSCPIFVPPHLGDTSLAVISPAHGTAAPVALPSCGDAARAGKLRGGYFPLGMFDLLYPEHRQPVGWDSTRLSAGHTRWVPYGCEWRHDGRRFADPASCVEKSHRALFIGDSHARAVFDLVSHRLSGNKTIVQKSVKSAHKNATLGNVHLVRPPLSLSSPTIHDDPELTLLTLHRTSPCASRPLSLPSRSLELDEVLPLDDLAHLASLARSLPHLNKTFTCETFGSYDSLTVSTVRRPFRFERSTLARSSSLTRPTSPPPCLLPLSLASFFLPHLSQGTWQAAVDCATTDTVLAELERLFTTWPRFASECRRPVPHRTVAVLDSSRARTTRFIYLNMPAFHPQLRRHDCRTGPRLSYWNERFAAMARKNGWEVVDVHALTKPVAIDMTLGDGVHCAFLLSFPLRRRRRCERLLTLVLARRCRDRRGGARGRRRHRKARTVRRDQLEGLRRAEGRAREAGLEVGRGGVAMHSTVLSSACAL